MSTYQPLSLDSSFAFPYYLSKTACPMKCLFLAFLLFRSATSASIPHEDIYDCHMALDCIKINESPAPAGTCGAGLCVKQVCLELVEQPGCPAEVDYVCDQSNEDGCPWDGSNFGQFWDSPLPPYDTPPCRRFSDHKCGWSTRPAASETTLCQYAAPHDKVFWIIKNGQQWLEENSSVVGPDGDTLCYMYKDWKLGGYFHDDSSTTGLNSHSCSIAESAL